MNFRRNSFCKRSRASRSGQLHLLGGFVLIVSGGLVLSGSVSTLFALQKKQIQTDEQFLAERFLVQARHLIRDATRPDFNLEVEPGDAAILRVGNQKLYVPEALVCRVVKASEAEPFRRLEAEWQARLAPKRAGIKTRIVQWEVSP